MMKNLRRRILACANYWQAKNLILLISLTVLSLTAVAQTSDRKWNLGLSGGLSTYAGELGNGVLDFRSSDFQQNLVLAGTLSRYLNSSFDLTFMVSEGTLGYYNTEGNATNFKGRMLHGNLNLKYKMNNGYIIPENAWVGPYAFLGAGATSFTGPRINPGMDYPIVGGVGARLRITEVLNLTYQMTFGYMSSAHYNPQQEPAERPSGNDNFILHTAGISFNIGKAKDADGDKVSDNRDKCPGTPEGVKVDANGCPLDSDGDGIVDYQDKCPATAGPSSTGGCPDMDKDGIGDNEDQCPNEAGTLALKGCPDADGDGITDAKDRCPSVKGSIAAEGCPDEDGDGVVDKDDMCPSESGTVALRGCPDRDGDGIEDSKDMCPSEKGPAATNGCPDSDHDGVNDGIDKCPAVAGSPTHSGCPDSDNDGVYDDVDKCKDLAGSAANMGCPGLRKEVLQQQTKQLFQKALQGIQFETGKAIIKPVSFPILNAIAKVVKDNPICELRVAGHTDNVGDDGMNMTLSADRAKAVVDYLIGHGADPARISSKGFGETRPVDTNSSEKGRTRNRRVEFNLEFLK